MCESCEVLNINGVNCHEHGCPEAWKTQTRECAGCGQSFKPDFREQNCCDGDCAKVYSGS